LARLGAGRATRGAPAPPKNRPKKDAVLTDPRPYFANSDQQCRNCVVIVAVRKQKHDNVKDQAMTNLMNKARTGRTNALAGLASTPGAGTEAFGNGIRFKTAYREGPVPFISKRAQNHASIWIH
jgi:hypothetical protein